MKNLRILFFVITACLITIPGRSAISTDDTSTFLELYKQLVEINTTLSSGSCTDAVNAMATRLRSSGIPDKDIHVIVPDAWPKQGNLVAVLPGTATNAETEAVMLLAHVDVVEAKREDWERDP